MELAPKKPPQYQTDLAAVMRIAVGDREYKFNSTLESDPDVLTDKQRRVITRVGKRVNLLSTFTVRGVVVRERDGSGDAYRTQVPRDYAAYILEQYNLRGGIT